MALGLPCGMRHAAIMGIMIKLCASTLLAASLAACAGTPGAQPHDMSVAQHEAMASEAERGAALHQAEYDADASAAARQCGRSDFSAGTGVVAPVCWTSASNPTTAHLDEAAKLRKIAADHRAASQSLRDAEARACVGLSDDDRDMSPFAHREDIAGVEPLTERFPSGKATYARVSGAVITFRALPGMTPQWLQRVIDCHLARNAALGHEVPEMPNCPLVPKNVTAQVTATSTGFAVAVRSDDVDTAREVLRRARMLVAQ